MTIPLEDVTFIGSGLTRPECVVTHRSGLVFAADWTDNGGVAIIAPDGTVTRHLSSKRRIRPNGIALEDDGSFLIAHLDDREGGVFRLHPSGEVTPVVTMLNGDPLPPTNFVTKDAMGRLYITVSTRSVPRHHAANPATADGFIVMTPPVGRSIVVAEALGYTNEAILSPDGESLFVNETFGRRTSRFPVNADGTLGERVVLADWGDGIYPDGLALDEDGGIWMVSIISNTVIRLDANSNRTTILEDRNEDFVREVEDAYRLHQLDRALLDRPHTGTLKNVSSLAFGGPDRQTAYLGCLLGTSIATFRARMAGYAPPHYSASLNALVAAGVIAAEFA